MKKYLLTILTICAITKGVYSQTSNQQINDIEKTVNEIKGNLSKYQKIEKAKDASGNKYIYKDGNDLKLVTVYVEDTDASKNVEWYFANGQLIYSQKVWTNKETNKVVSIDKCYLTNGQLAAWTKDDKAVNTSSDEFMQVSTDLTAYGKELISQSK